MSRILLLQGNQAVVEGAIAAGVKFYGGYPITPSTEIAEQLALRLPQVGGKFMQTEDEIAGLGTVIGASMAGKKAMTATSGPGFSLKQEMLGLACSAEIPCVIVNVQRVGPATGQPTSPAQGEVMQTRWGTHGDHWLITVSPSSVPECFDLTLRAVALSEKYRCPVIMMKFRRQNASARPAHPKIIWLTAARKAPRFLLWQTSAAVTAGTYPVWYMTKPVSRKAPAKQPAPLRTVCALN